MEIIDKMFRFYDTFYHGLKAVELFGSLYPLAVELTTWFV